MLSQIKRLVFLAVAWSLAAGAAQAAVTPFQTDVATAITNGLAYLDARNVFQNPSGAGNAAGLTTLALLEKRASGNPGDPPQGYNGASSADQARLRRSVAYLITVAAGNPNTFYAYVDGGFLSALSTYALTGGPDSCGPAPNTRSCAAFPSTPAELQNLGFSLQQAIDNMVDNTLAAQRTVANGWPNDYTVGYWCYNAGNCTDSSTTQYATLGLSAAQSVYNNPTFGDPGARLPKIATALAAAANVYATDAAQGSQDPGCDPGGYKTTPHGTFTGTPADPNAYGHGYHSPGENYAPSLQQTASGAFVQLLGGSNINSPMVQGYMRWIYDHYRYTDVGGINGAGNLYNFWAQSYFYYLWSSFKGMEFLAQKGIAPNPGNLGITSYGTLDPTAAPACTDRQLHRDPATVQRVPSFGAGGVGFYSAESKTQYFDYAYSILSYQCAPNALNNPGGFFCPADPAAGGAQNPDSGGGWGTWDTQAYGLLVLQRATGVVLPTATLVSDKATAVAGTTVHLTWTSQNANSCAASGGTVGDGWTGNALATSGTLPVTQAAAGTYTYTITCSAGAQTAQAQVQVTFTKAAVLMCDVSGPNKVPDGEVSQYDINAIMGMLGQKVQPAGPAPAAADPMGAGVITVQDARACVLRCTKAGCAN